MKPTPFGHAVAAPPDGDLSSVQDIEGAQFVLVRVSLRDLWPLREAMDLDFVRHTLDVAAGYRKQVVFQIECRSFSEADRVTPDWLEQHDLVYRGGRNTGHQLAMWRPDAMSAVIEAHQALCNLRHPALLGTATEESAVGQDPGAYDYGPYEYCEQIRRLPRELEAPNHRLFQFLNWIKGGQHLLPGLMQDCAAHGAAVGGPDLLLHDEAVTEHVYPALDAVGAAGFTFLCMQPNSYRELREHAYGHEQYLILAENLGLNAVIWYPFGGAIEDARPTIAGPVTEFSRNLLWPTPHPDIVAALKRQHEGAVALERELQSQYSHAVRDAVAASRLLHLATRGR